MGCVKGEEGGGQGEAKLFILGRAGMLRVAHPSHKWSFPLLLLELAEHSRTPHCLCIIKSEN